MTAQVHEHLIFDGEETSMAFCPPIPRDHPRIVELDPEEARPSSSGILFSTACWRQYLGTWEIKDGKFYLVGIEGVLQLQGGEPLLADWFTGVLRVPRGEMLQYIHMGFGSIFEKEVHIKIEKGIVTQTQIIDNRGKSFDQWDLGMSNLPGLENRFPGDDRL